MFFISLFYFTGLRTLVVDLISKKIFRGTINGLPSFGDGRRWKEYILFENDGTKELKFYPIWNARVDTIIDPPEWNPMEKPIAFHRNQYDDDTEDNYYHVFLCAYCNVYTHDLHGHRENQHEITRTPKVQRFMCPRRLF